MRLLARIVCSLVLVMALAVPGMAREEISNFVADVTMHSDGSVVVTETVEVNAEGLEIRRGIYRDIPTVMVSASGQKIRSELNVSWVSRDGQAEPFRTERMGNFVRIWIGDSDRFVTRGAHRYEITYSMSRMARSFADHDELYWNATGNYWIFPIVKSSARVTLPEGAEIEDVVGYTGVVGSTEQAVTSTRTSPRTASFVTTRSLGAGEGMSFAVKFQKGILVPPTGLDALLLWLSDLREILLPLAGVAAVLGYNVLAWSRVGRDPAKGTIIPLFHPPKDFSPPLTHYVHHWGFSGGGWPAMTAAIFDLGVKGLLKIDNTNKKLSVTMTGQQPREKLPTAEAGLFGWLQAKATLVVDKATGPELQKQHAAFVEAIERENRTVWFNHNVAFAVVGVALAAGILGLMAAFDVLEPLWLIAAVFVGIVLGIGWTVFNTLWKGKGFGRFFLVLWLGIIGFDVFSGGLDVFTQLSINTAALAAASIVLITVIFAVLMRAPTIQGRKVMDQIEGLKMYIETAEKDRMNIIGEPPMTIERFERLLPYAIALGVEKPWSEHFEAELARNAVSDVPAGVGYQPHWSSGTARLAPGKMASSISAAAAGMSAAMVAAQPVQASSSGFSSGSGGGGGISGGGGGGGGGGGW